MFLKNVAGQYVFAQVNSRADGSPLTSAVSIATSIDGGSDGAGSGTLTHLANGSWRYAPTQGETNGESIRFAFTHATGIDVTITAITDPGDVYARIGAAGAGLTALGDTRIANLDATISSRTKPADTQAAVTTCTNLTNAPTSGDLTSTMKTSVTTACTASTPTAAAVTGAVGSVTGAVGSVTARVTANADQLAGQTITAAAGVTFPASVASPTNISAGTITTVTNLTNAPTVGDFTSTMKTSLNAATPAVTVSDKTGFSLSSAGVQAIWDALTSALTAVGSIGKLLVTNIDAAISSRSTYAGGDTSGTTTLLSRITSGRATNLDNLDATVSSRLATSGYTVAPTTAAIADKILGRNLAGGSDGGRTVQDALRPSRNKVTISGGTLTVYAEDDSTPAWTGAVTTDVAAEPIVTVDPA